MNAGEVAEAHAVLLGQAEELERAFNRFDKALREGQSPEHRREAWYVLQHAHHHLEGAFWSWFRAREAER